LNYYISAGNDSTIFYNAKSNAAPIEYPNKLTKNVYHLYDLDEAGRFLANSGDAYLLDVSQIHAVNKQSPSTRLFLNYSWFSASFCNVLMDIEKVNDGHI
jgi:hypothetical protein